MEWLTILLRDWWYGRPDDLDCGWGERGLRSPQWSTVRKHHLEKEYKCQWCGAKKLLSVHHIVPFHVQPDLELEDDNLITLCEGLFRNCHFRRGHVSNWKKSDPEIRVECMKRNICRLVEENPIKEGKPRQHWSFIVPFPA